MNPPMGGPSFIYRTKAGLKEDGVSYYRSLGVIYTGLLCAFGVLYLSEVSTLTPIQHALVGICVFVVVAILQYQMVTAMHEGLHQHLMPRSKGSNLITLFLNFYPIGANQSYWDIHMAHHKYFGDYNLDPDIHLYRRFPNSKIQFVILLSQYILGVSTFRRLLLISKNNFRRKEHLDLVFMILTQLAILALFSFIFIPLYYLLFWLLPLATFAKGLNDLRTFAEHSSPSGKPTLRSFASSDLVACLIGSFGFRFHAEHHIYPMVPHGRLEEARAYLATTGHRTAGYTVEVFRGNHLQLLYHWFCSLPLTRARVSVKA